MYLLDSKTLLISVGIIVAIIFPFETTVASRTQPPPQSVNVKSENDKLLYKVPPEIIETRKSGNLEGFSGIILPTNCGKQKIKPNINGPTLNRILNGQNAKANSWPWMVSLRYFGDGYMSNHQFNGVLISNQYVLTNAVFLENIEYEIENYGSSLAVVVGMHNAYNFTGTTVYFATSFKKHYNYSYYNGYSNNIGLIKLNWPVPESDKTSFICLPSSSKDSADVYGKNVVFAGWGYINDHYQMATSLRQGVLRVQNNSYCKSFKSDFDSNRRFCALSDNRKTTPCLYDWGGPLMFYKNNTWYAYGILTTISLSGYTCNKTAPTYFTKIPNYLDWIKTTSKQL